MSWVYLRTPSCSKVDSDKLWQSRVLVDSDLFGDGLEGSRINYEFLYQFRTPDRRFEESFERNFFGTTVGFLDSL